MKIAVISDVIYPWVKGGGERRYYEVYKRLAQKHEVHWYTMFYKGMPSKNFVHEGMNVHCVCKAPENLYCKARRKILPAIKFSLAIIPALVRERFDVIDSNQFPYLHNFPVKLFKKNRFIISWLEVWDKDYCREYCSPLIFHVQNSVLKLPDKIASISESTTRKIILLGVDEDKVVTIPLGINLVKTKSKKVKNRILFVGRLIKEKNIGLVLQAVRILKDKNVRVEFIVQGEGPEKENLKKKAKKLGLNDRVVFKGFVKTYQDIAELMASSKVFVLPSEREGFGLALLEAMSNDCVCLTLDHEDNAAMEFAKQGRGLILKKNAEAWAEAIEQVLKGKTWPDQKKIKSYIKTKTWDGVAQQVNKLLEGL